MKLKKTIEIYLVSDRSGQDSLDLVFVDAQICVAQVQEQPGYQDAKPCKTPNKNPKKLPQSRAFRI
jgi:hypothetical protein